MTRTENRPGPAALRIAVEVALVAAAIALVSVVTRGLTPLFPGLAAALRMLLHPFVLLGIGAMFLLVRMGGGRRRRGG